MAHVAVLGAGAWGTALSRLLAERHSVVLWTHSAAHAAALAATRENTAYLAGFPLPPAVSVTSELAAAVSSASLVVLAVPSPSFRSVLAAAAGFLASEAALVSCSKGIEPGTLMLLSEVVEDVLGAGVRERYAVLSGPSFAAEVASGQPTNVVAAAHDHELSLFVQQSFASERFRVYSSDDPVGVEVGGALKNVIAIAAGACDGLGFGNNTRAALITRGIAELARLAVAKNGQALTLAGLAGVGDLVLTCTGQLSRNRTVGFELGRGRSLPQVLAGLGHVAEGVTTAESAYQLGQKLKVELPISSEVYRVLFEDKPVLEAVRDVLARPLKREW